MDKRESKERLESRANSVKWSSTSLRETERSSGRTFNRVIWPIKINPFDVCCPNNSENRRRIQGLAGCLLAKNNATRIDFKPPQGCHERIHPTFCQKYFYNPRFFCNDRILVDNRWTLSNSISFRIICIFSKRKAKLNFFIIEKKKIGYSVSKLNWLNLEW